MNPTIWKFLDVLTLSLITGTRKHSLWWERSEACWAVAFRNPLPNPKVFWILYFCHNMAISEDIQKLRDGNKELVEQIGNLDPKGNQITKK